MRPPGDTPAVKTFHVEVLTPAGAGPARTVAALDVPAVRGRLTVLAGHEPLICRLRPGTVKFTLPEDEALELWDIGEGTMSVAPGGDVSLLVQAASIAS